MSPAKVKWEVSENGDMTTPGKDHNKPFVIRPKGEKWEVVAIIDGEFQEYIICDTLERAEAVADIRIIWGFRLTRQKCECARVDRALDALSHAGYDEGLRIYRSLSRYRDELGNE